MRDWLNERTGWRHLARKLFYENIPGGARWRYVFGSTLIFCVGVQVITGIALWMNYSPSVQTAWESVNYLQNVTAGGWLLRGIHHYTAQILPVLLALYLMQIVVDNAYQAPREVNFWVTVALMQVVLLIALTGYQLPWDQKGFWATKVAMNILGIVPFVGRDLQTMLIGGPDYGQLTLTHFFAIHAGLLPALLLILVAIHVYLSRYTGLAGKKHPGRADSPYWPDQFFKNAVACLAVVCTLLFLILRHRISSPTGVLGAELGAPADPSEPYSAARPEWYFLFLYQFLKYFPGSREIIGALVVPGVVVGIILAMPFIARSKSGQRFNVGFLGCLFVGVGLLTYLALSADARNPDYQAALKDAGREAARVKELADSPMGVPPAGALAMLRNDSLTQGPKLFAKNCASCHRFQGGDGLGHLVKDPQSASDLAGFGSRAWLAGLLDPAQIVTTNYFGATKHAHDKMVKFVLKDVAKYTPEQKAQLVEVIAAVSAEAQLKSQITADARDTNMIVEGRTLLRDTMKCTDCHQFRVRDDEAMAPDLTGYGSREWLVQFISNPAHARFYGDDNDRMPAFGAKKILSGHDIGLIADWLRGDWYEPAPSVASH
jgi:ubiquinol-cytochrome c reductase cytochrome b subunit